MCIFVFSSSLVLALILGIVMLVVGETSMSIDLTLDFSRFDGLWMIAGLPAISLLIFVVLSPFSYLIHRLLSK
jgi:hypothetical protein